MKKTTLLLVALMFAFVCKAQWKVAVEDDGFDSKSYVATAISKDGEAKISLVLVKQGIVLGVRTPEIVYRDNDNDVELTFKINGENKTHKLTGWSSRGDSYIMLSPGGVHEIGELMTDEFVEDFKKASAIKLKISYSVPYRGTSYKSYEEYVFNMTGSTNAYNRVAKQK
jgi:hypothetical protein